MDKEFHEPLELCLQEYEFTEPENPVTVNSWIPAFAGMTYFAETWESSFTSQQEENFH